MLSAGEGDQHRHQGPHVRRNRGHWLGHDSQNRHTGRQRDRKITRDRERWNVFGSTCDWSGRSHPGRVVTGSESRGEESGIRNAGRRSAAVARNLVFSSMRRLHPRSPYEKLGGYVHLPRLIDKAKLQRKGLLNGYNYKTVGFDKHLLAFLKLNGDDFEEAANRFDDVSEILQWVDKNGMKHSTEEIEHWNQE